MVDRQLYVEIKSITAKGGYWVSKKTNFIITESAFFISRVNYKKI